jgi:hypothetical protein
LRRHVLMEEIRLLEQQLLRGQNHRQHHEGLAQGRLTFQLDGASAQNPFNGQGSQSDAFGKLVTPRLTSSSLGFSKPGVGRDWSLLRIGLDDVSRLKAAPRLQDQPSLVSPLSHKEGAAKPFVVAPPKRYLLQPMGGYQLPTSSGFESLDPFLKNLFGKGAETILKKRMQLSAGIVKGQSRSLPLRASSFPLPPLKQKQTKARKAKGASLLSYKMIWADLNVRSSRFRKELFSRRVSRNKVRIAGKPGSFKVH